MSEGLITVRDMIGLLAVLADPTRLRLVRLLRREELCVCELVDALRIPQYRVSRHLARLRDVGLVQARRNGRWMYYSVGRGGTLSGFHQDLLKLIDVHLDGAHEMKRDDARLTRRIALRQSGRCVVGMTCC